nr:beta-galactosidase [Edaphobacter lichenicola]
MTLLTVPKWTLPRNRVLSYLLPSLVFFLSFSTIAQQPVVIDARAPVSGPKPVQAALGTSTRPDGQSLTVNSQYLLLDDKPWLPVMGEFHYSRVPRQDWEAEILKMKAGGVQIIATYVIWLHQEEVEGKFDWSDRRDLRAFVALCSKHGMYVYPRIGPWAHGEVRNGGLPDWVLSKGPVRRNDPTYLAEVGTFYQQIADQLQGELWKDGGPVVGIQIENEYRDDGKPGSGVEHIRMLKKLARDAGLDVPLYTVTGWDGAAIPLDAVLPVYGGYPDAPWDGLAKKMPPNEVYTFRTANRIGGNMGIIGGRGQNPASSYAGTPFLTAEVGGGLEDTYFRRPVLSTDDIAAIPTVLIGSGANLMGFYMFQGGRNPEGKLTTLQESQATGYPTDVPVKSYDFQAPLGEFGGERPSFRRLKLVNYFLNDFGELLAPMTPSFPAALPASPADLSVPRLSARTSGNHGFLFINNYLRGETMPDRKQFSVALKTSLGMVVVPAKPIDLPSGAYGIWPVNLNLGGLTLRYSTAQLFHRFTVGEEAYFCFFAIPGIDPELALETSQNPVSLSSSLIRHTEDGVTYLNTHDPAQIQQIVYQIGAKKIHLLLFSREQAEHTWRVPGQSFPLLTSADFYADEHTVTLQSNGDPNISFSIFDRSSRPTTSASLRSSKPSDLLTTYASRLSAVSPKGSLQLVSLGSHRDPLHYGSTFSWRKQPIPVAPDDQDFEHASRWTLDLPKLAYGDVSDIRIFIEYQGDVARLSSGGKLVDDDFWNGRPWELSLKDLRQEGVDRQAELKVLGWPKDSPMYLEAPTPSEAPRDGLSAKPVLRLIPQYQLEVHLAP